MNTKINILKNMKKLLLPLLLASLMAGCSDDTTETPSTVDPVAWTFDQYKDTSYKPGDNFYMYCIGSWWEQAEIPAGEIQTGMKLSGASDFLWNVRYQEWQATSADYVALRRDTANINQTTDAAIAYVKSHTALLQSVASKQDAWKATAKLAKLGYTTIMAPEGTGVKDGEIKLRINIFDIFGGCGNGSTESADTYTAQSLQLLGYTEEQATNIVETTMGVKDKLKGMFTDYNAVNFTENPDSSEYFMPVAELEGVDPLPANQMASELGIEVSDIFFFERQADALNVLAALEPQEVVALAATAMANELVFASDELAESYNSFADDTANVASRFNAIEERLMSYIASYEFAQKYVSAELKAKFLAYCEELRTVFMQRLDRLDWMSQTTKQSAKEKLQAMSFHVGYPDEWREEFMAHPTGNSFVEDYLRLNAANKCHLIYLTGRRLSEHFLEQDIIEEDHHSFFECVNAFYSTDANSLEIYPTIMLPPIFDESETEASQYATLQILGHEMTHGFDNEGSKFDKNGRKANWWTSSDKLEYNARLQKLVQCYNMLEIDPDVMPGVFCNGEKTLGENVANLGGTLIAYEAYVNKLRSQGYYGDELAKQEKKFFESYAVLVSAKYTPARLRYLYENDTHANAKEEINGTTMNIDRWYELYNVAWGDILYLKPEQRAYIW